MSESDIAISAGGSTLYELLVTRILVLVLLRAENKVRVSSELDGKSVINLGYEDNIINNFKGLLI